MPEDKSRQQQQATDLQEHCNLLSEKLIRLRKQHIGETRAEEKFRLERLIIETEGERDRIEQELQTLESQYSQNKPEPDLPIWNIPYRQNPYFTGRKTLLETLHKELTPEHAAALTQPQIIIGLGGIGKTQTALEYAYRHWKDYRIIWWIRAEEPATLAADYTKLAIKLDLPEHKTTEQAIQIQAVHNWLERHTDWLLIFDNAEERHHIRPYVPRIGQGQVLITSRNPIWDGLGTTLPVEVMQPEEALAFLAKRTHDPDPQAAATLAKTLGYLPLALEQAAAYIRKNSISLDQYQTLFQKHHTQLLQYGLDHHIGHFQPLKMIVKVFERLGAREVRRFTQGLQHSHLATEYPDTVATTWELSFQKVQKTSPAAADFLNLCAFLAHDAIFLDMIIKGTDYLPEQLADAVTNPLALDKLISTLLHYSLMQKKGNTLTMHHLVQSVLRNRLNPATQRRWAERAVQIVNQAFPVPEFTSWSHCEQLLPHVRICAKWIEKWKLKSEEPGQLLNNAGSYLHSRGTYAEAEPLSQQALIITEKALGAEHPYVATNLNNLARLYADQGRYAEAEPLYQRARAITKNPLEPEYSSLTTTTTTLHNLALLFKSQGRYAEAEPLYQQVLETIEETLGIGHADLNTTRNNLANLYAEQNRYTEAESLYKQVLTTTKKTLGPEHPDSVITLHNLARLYYDQRRYTEAEPLYQQTLAIAEKTLKTDHPHLAAMLNNLANLYHDQGHYAKAKPLYQRALVIREKTLRPDHPELATTLENYATLLHKIGQDTEATTLETRAQAIRDRHAEKNPKN